MESINNETCAMTESFESPTGESAWSYWSTICSSLKVLQHNIEDTTANGCV
eukprot:CAMPEP_0198348268 /NCGR_PEP_ID=MMETSP1450-20131203/89061_1 /TAXON_ID=753684 ORGANISM="Madagascaria erythrocladiodes, Strain CCMP3234" /NCGR_SAMPLE_ID=MMETSP1450 /ASSEMBLY_ACC=CAM_ASM_001115 /LENGTH=50 /DNA_ID=CAMNT_0044053879 /DNA_START=21 /DNA_END=169 /DNA_ORIENTATION=+